MPGRFTFMRADMRSFLIILGIYCAGIAVSPTAPL